MTAWGGITGAALLGSALVGCSGPVEVAATAPGTEATATCSRLLDALPDTVDDQSRRAVTPEDALAAAWGDPAIVLRCGVDRPDAMTPDAQLFEVDGLGWLPEQLTGGYVFTTSGRTVYVEVTVPDDYAPEVNAVVDLGGVVAATVPETAAAGSP